MLKSAADGHKAVTSDTSSPPQQTPFTDKFTIANRPDAMANNQGPSSPRPNFLDQTDFCNTRSEYLNSPRECRYRVHHFCFYWDFLIFSTVRFFDHSSKKVWLFLFREMLLIFCFRQENEGHVRPLLSLCGVAGHQCERRIHLWAGTRLPVLRGILWTVRLPHLQTIHSTIFWEKEMKRICLNRIFTPAI